MRSETLGIVILLAVTTARPAAAEREVSLTMGPHAAPSASVDAVTADRALPSVAIAAALDLIQLDRLGAVELEASFEETSTSGTVFQRIETEMMAHSFRLGARLRHRFGGELAGFARAAAGYTTATLALTDDPAAATRSTIDRAHGVSILTGGGVDYTPSWLFPRFRVRLGLRAEVDYTHYSPLRFTASPESAGDTLAIRVHSAELGELRLSGLSARFGLFGRF